MTSAHNARVRRENHLQELDRSELCTLLLQNDSTLLPPVCFSYNRGDGEYGSCPDQESCRRLHLCDRYLKGTCRAEVGCPRSHDLFEPHPLKTLQERQVPNELIGSLLPIFKNIQAMKTSGNKQPTHAGHESTTRKAPEKTEICMYFIKSSCKQGDKCWKEHCKLPYKWEVKSGNGWSALPENENIERDFCDPSKDYRCAEH
ncbi:hypothetical protein JZ751_025341 [Albula glossodonta]|uniref:C3H1-type domain-containing protein n=1 Tax=Albula glossodonta TaxID=121402 RepID=A0A8T2MS86_9TELE|nr:hypothetical protein JZ751_025341 [Albula glossodonta]